MIYSLAERGAREIRVINRTFARAKNLEDTFGGPVKAYMWDDRTKAVHDCAMLVNTTSQGMIGMAPLDMPLNTLSASALVADIIYIPRETPLLREARLRGNATVNGLGMLLHQARPAWKAWFNLDPQVTPELRALLEGTL